MYATFAKPSEEQKKLMTGLGFKMAEMTEFEGYVYWTKEFVVYDKSCVVTLRFMNNEIREPVYILDLAVMYAYKNGLEAKIKEIRNALGFIGEDML